MPDFYNAQKAAVRESESVADSKCNGRSCFEVIVRGRKIRRESYWCDRQRCYIDPYEPHCPLEPDLNGEARDDTMASLDKEGGAI